MDFDKITNAPTVDDALRISGELGKEAHFMRIDYIKHVMGPRACGGFFQTTRGNVTAKFRQAWQAANSNHDATV